MEKLNNNIRQEVSKILISIGIPANLQGFNYFKIAITKVLEKPEYLRKVTKVLYPEIGKLYNVSGAIVERSMRHALDTAYTRKKFLVLNDMLQTNVIDPYYKPSSSELIALVTEYIRWNFDIADDRIV